MNGLISKKTGLVVMALTAGLAVHADTLLFYNLASPAGLFKSEGNTIGDQVILADNGYGAIITDFSFDLYATGVASDSLATYTITLYANDGTGGTPSTVLWTDSSMFASAPNLTTGTEVNYAGLDISVSSSFTWAISFSNLDSGAAAGLVLSTTAPTTGYDYTDYWLKTDTGWSTQVGTSVSRVDFLASFEGTVVETPEPSSVALLSLGSASLLFWRRRSARGSK